MGVAVARHLSPVATVRRPPMDRFRGSSARPAATFGDR